MRFRATGRYVDAESTAKTPYTAHAHEQYPPPRPSPTAGGPEMAFRADATKPQAKIVVQAETHEQLHQILLTLDNAINSYGRTSRPENSRSHANR